MQVWQIILAIVIVGLSIILPIYYAYKKKDLENKLKDFFKKYDPKFKDQEENQEDF